MLPGYWIRNGSWRSKPWLLARHMRRFIITGAPGAGKTAIIRQLELDGFSVVEEAATDVIRRRANPRSS